MSKQFSETHEPSANRRIDASAYSARVQEAMRYDKLPSSSYSLVMTILNAVSRGYSYEKWQEEQQRALKILTDLPPDPKTAHADVENRYEQAISCLQDISLWPW
jgi:hypothetical protein